MEKISGYVGFVDSDGIMFVYKDSESLRKQIKAGKVTDRYIFTKTPDEGMEIPEKGYNIYNLFLIKD